jgi:hypothetical protein
MEISKLQRHYDEPGYESQFFPAVTFRGKWLAAPEVQMVGEIIPNATADIISQSSRTFSFAEQFLCPTEMTAVQTYNHYYSSTVPYSQNTHIADSLPWDPTMISNQNVDEKYFSMPSLPPPLYPPVPAHQNFSQIASVEKGNKQKYQNFSLASKTEHDVHYIMDKLQQRQGLSSTTLGVHNSRFENSSDNFSQTSSHESASQSSAGSADIAKVIQDQLSVILIIGSATCF